MATLEDVAGFALTLPDVTEIQRYRHRAWSVNGKVFAWERPFSKADLTRFGDRQPPAGEILALSTADLSEKAAVIAADPTAFFTIEHFADYPAVLVVLDVVTPAALREAVRDAWLVCAPPGLAESYLADQAR